MKRLFKVGLLFSYILFFHISAFAQNNQQQIDNALKVFDDLQRTYEHPTGLSFDVKYIYTNETNPDNVLDSLAGKFEMSNNKYRYILDSTETIHTDKYTIILFREDKIMYLTKAALQTQANPIEAIGAFLKSNKGMSCHVAAVKNLRVLSIKYPPGMEYKQINLVVDTLTGYLVKAEYTVQIKMLMETQLQNDANEANDYDEYARVEADFSNYKQDKLDTTEFDENNFFQRDGNNFKTSEAYRNYKIFIGSSNL